MQSSILLQLTRESTSFHTYADRTHHGEEEGILLRDLKQREMTDEQTIQLDVLYYQA